MGKYARICVCTLPLSAGVAFSLSAFAGPDDPSTGEDPPSPEIEKKGIGNGPYTRIATRGRNPVTVLSKHGCDTDDRRQPNTRAIDIPRGTLKKWQDITQDYFATGELEETRVFAWGICTDPDGTDTGQTSAEFIAALLAQHAQVHGCVDVLNVAGHGQGCGTSFKPGKSEHDTFNQWISTPEATALQKSLCKNAIVNIFSCHAASNRVDHQQMANRLCRKVCACDQGTQDNKCAGDWICRDPTSRSCP